MSRCLYCGLYGPPLDMTEVAGIQTKNTGSRKAAGAVGSDYSASNAYSHTLHSFVSYDAPAPLVTTDVLIGK